MEDFEFIHNDEEIVLKGNKRTYILRNCIKNHGGTWNAKVKSWIFHKQTNIDELRSILNIEYSQQLDEEKRRKKIKQQVRQEEIREHNIGAVKYSFIEEILSKSSYDYKSGDDDCSMDEPHWDFVHLYVFVIPTGKRKAQWMSIASINDRRRIHRLEKLKSVFESYNVVCKIERDDFK